MNIEISRKGFTIVELLIVIVVIAVLASISVVAFSGFQTRAENSLRYQELNDWMSVFKLYKAQYGQYPNMPSAGYCLGTGFPVADDGVARCRDYQNPDPVFGIAESGNASLMSELQKVANPLPKSNRTPVLRISPNPYDTVGPYIYYQAGEIQFFSVIKSDGTCPSNLKNGYTDGSRTLCTAVLPK